MDRIKQIEDNLKMILRHWGFGEIFSSIYATLTISDKPLTAKEISEHINYAYTTTINALNQAIGLRHIRKIRQGRKNVYLIETDLAGIINDRLKYFLKLLEETEKSLHQLDKGYRDKLRGVFKTINDAVSFLKRLREVRTET